MSDIVDDLLQEVEQLEASTQELNDNVEKVEQQKATLDSSDAPSPVDTNLLALEAAKTTQEAAKQSHLAAKSSIKLADQLKARNLELDDLSNNWRQATRNTQKDVSAAKNHFTLMMTTTLIINVVALSVIGYFFYATNQNNSQARTEVLDIIQTENALFNKKMTRKIDQISNLTESLSADIRKLSSQNTEVSSANDAKPADQALQSKSFEKTSAELKTQHSELKSLIENIVTTQKDMDKVPALTGGEVKLDSKQLKKLNDLSWLVRKQAKTLKAIQTSLTNQQPGTVNNTGNKGASKAIEGLKAELHALNQQQKAIQDQVKKLHSDFTKYISKPKAYSYNSSACNNANCSK